MDPLHLYEVKSQSILPVVKVVEVVHRVVDSEYIYIIAVKQSGPHLNAGILYFCSWCSVDHGGHISGS